MLIYWAPNWHMKVLRLLPVRYCSITELTPSLDEYEWPSRSLHAITWLLSAHVVAKTPRSSRVTPVVKSLHWLKINERVKYKLLSLQQTNLNISRTWFLFNLVTMHVLHLWSLLLVHLPGFLSLFGMLRRVYGKNWPLIFASLVRYSLLHFHLSHMAVHHLHYPNRQFHLLLLVQAFILNLRLGSSAKPFLHRPFPFVPDRTGL